jgi:hypothetical protein
VPGGKRPPCGKTSAKHKFTSTGYNAGTWTAIGTPPRAYSLNRPGETGTTECDVTALLQCQLAVYQLGWNWIFRVDSIITSTAISASRSQLVSRTLSLCDIARLISAMR